MFGQLLEVAMSKKCTPLWREAHFQVKMYKTRGVQTTFGSADVKKEHAVVARSTFWLKMLKLPHVRATFGSANAVVARSTFPSENVQNTWGSDHFLTIRWRFDVEKVHAVVARSTFGSEHLKKKTLHAQTTFWRFDGDSMSKKCAPLWREAHLEVESVKNWRFWATFEVSVN